MYKKHTSPDCALLHPGYTTPEWKWIWRSLYGA